jgi:Flp pilus assembly protein TadG
VTVQAVVLVPLTLLLLFAIVQFSVAWYAKLALTAAAEDGLRYTQTNPTRAPETSATQSAMSNAGFVSGLTVTVRGQVPAAFPGFSWTITGSATGPLEIFRPQGR